MSEKKEVVFIGCFLLVDEMRVLSGIKETLVYSRIKWLQMSSKKSYIYAKNRWIADEVFKCSGIEISAQGVSKILMKLQEKGLIRIEGGRLARTISVFDAGESCLSQLRLQGNLSQSTDIGVSVDCHTNLSQLRKVSQSTEKQYRDNDLSDNDYSEYELDNPPVSPQGGKPPKKKNQEDGFLEDDISENVKVTRFNINEFTIPSGWSKESLTWMAKYVRHRAGRIKGKLNPLKRNQIQLLLKQYENYPRTFHHHVDRAMNDNWFGLTGQGEPRKPTGEDMPLEMYERFLEQGWFYPEEFNRLKGGQIQSPQGRHPQQQRKSNLQSNDDFAELMAANYDWSLDDEKE